MAHALVPANGDASLRSLVQIAGEAMSSFRRFLCRTFGWLIAVAGFLCPAGRASHLGHLGHRLFEFAALGWRPPSRRSQSGLWFSSQRRMSVYCTGLAPRFA
jgi:hypothetical protein